MQHPAGAVGDSSEAGIAQVPLGSCEICASSTRLRARPCQAGVNRLSSALLSAKPQQESIFTSTQLLREAYEAKQLWLLTNSAPRRTPVVP